MVLRSQSVGEQDVADQQGAFSCAGERSLELPSFPLSAWRFSPVHPQQTPFLFLRPCDGLMRLPRFTRRALGARYSSVQ